MNIDRDFRDLGRDPRDYADDSPWPRREPDPFLHPENRKAGTSFRPVLHWHVYVLVAAVLAFGFLVTAAPWLAVLLAGRGS